MDAQDQAAQPTSVALEPAETAPTTGPTTGPMTEPTTGNTEVDEVVASVEALDGVPVDEHVATFEKAHDRLRRALDGRDG